MTNQKKKTNIIIAIDPGRSGGVAIVNASENGHIIRTRLYNCPDSPEEMADIIFSVRNEAYVCGGNIIAIIEHVWSFPTDARSAAFKFGTNYGMWIGIFGALRINHEKASPQKWMKMYGPLPKLKKDRKNKLKAIAKEINNKATLKTCDALLLANYVIEQKKEGAQNV
jgi:hypothetical protein